MNRGSLLSDEGFYGGLAVQLLWWLLVILLFVWGFGLVAGLIIGHVIGVGCTLFGVPSRWIWRS